MNTYELTVLVRTEKDIEVVKTLLEAAKGKVTKQDAWGEKKDLAYPIKKETAAFFYTLDIEIDGAIIEDFKKKMNYEEKILRYLLLTRI